MALVAIKKLRIERIIRINPQKDYLRRYDLAAFLLIAIVIISVGICYYAAKHRGLSKPYWIFMGAFFGPLAVPFVFLAKPKRKNNDGAH